LIFYLIEATVLSLSNAAHKTPHTSYFFSKWGSVG